MTRYTPSTMNSPAIPPRPTYDLVLRQGRLYPSLEPMDMGIRSQAIAAIAPQLPGSGTVEIDATQHLVSPPFVESHIHLDSVLTAGSPRWNQSGTLFEGIEIWAEYKQNPHT
jgi:cytosine deaminase